MEGLIGLGMILSELGNHWKVLSKGVSGVWARGCHRHDSATRYTLIPPPFTTDSLSFPPASHMCALLHDFYSFTFFGLITSPSSE